MSIMEKEADNPNPTRRIGGGDSKRDREVVERVCKLIEPYCETEGIELVCVEYVRETQGRTLRLYLDRPGGVTLDDCTHISRQAGDLLDVALDDIGAYRLEVSSPGVNRPLSKVSDFETYKGGRAELRTRTLINGRKKFKGILGDSDENCVKLKTLETSLAIPYREIVRARLIP